MDRPRNTLTSEGPFGNAARQSYTTAPSSAIKKPATNNSNNPLRGARQSVAGTAHHPYQLPLRTSVTSGTNYGSNYQEPNMNMNMNGTSLQASRRSTLASRSNNDLRESRLSTVGGGGDGGFMGRTPQATRSIPGSTRRSSVFPPSSRGRPSMAHGIYSGGLTKDPRPIKDKTFQANCSRNITEYLLSARYPTPLVAKSLTSPTAKEFQIMFKFLIENLVDPGMTWGKKFEDDALVVLKDLKYPGLDSVSKTAFTAPGSPQSWSGMLAMLNWLVEICKAHENWNDGHVIADPFLLSPHQLPLDHPHLEDRLLWDFAAKTYDQWFDGGAEEFPEAEHEFELVYERMATTAFGESQKLETTFAQRKTELQQLHAQEPPLGRLENEYVQLMSDKTKFIAFIDLHKQKAEKTRQAILKIREAISGQEQDLTVQRGELAQIENAVAVQNLTPDEVNRMNHERESLNRGLDDLRSKSAEAVQLAYDQEMAVTKSMDRFENLLADYDALCHQIGLVQRSSSSDFQYTSNIDIDFKIDLDLNIEDIEELKASGSQMRTTIRQNLQALRERNRQEDDTLTNATIALEYRVDGLKQEVERQKENVATSEVQLRTTQDQAEAAQNSLTAEIANNNKVIAVMQSEVTSMMAASQQGVLSTESKLESTRIAYTELQHKTAILQDSLLAQIGSHIDVIMKAKQHAQNSLRSIRTLAEN